MRSVLNDAEKIVCAAIFTVMTILGFMNIVVRYVTNYSFAATQEILLNGFLLLTIFGAAIAARRGEHLAVTLLYDLLPTVGKRVLLWLSACLSVLLLFLAAWYCWELILNQYRSGIVSYSLQIPAWYYNVGLPFGFLLIVLRFLQHTFEISRMLSGRGVRDV